MNTGFALELTRLVTGSIAAVGHLTPLELGLAAAEVVFAIVTLALPRMIARRQRPGVEARTDYEEAA